MNNQTEVVTEDGWIGQSAGSDFGEERGLALALALMRTREYLVFGPCPEHIDRPSGWPGTRPGRALHALSTGVRLQLATMDLLSDLTVTLKTSGTSKPVWTPRIARITSLAGKHYIVEPEPDDCRKALADVEAMATLRAERSVEIFAQQRFNPAFWATVLPLDPKNTPYTLELMGAVVSIASFVVQRCKAFLGLPRPAALSPRIQPMLPAPLYSTYPGGHATESSLLALVLVRLLSDSLTPSHPEPLPPWLDTTKKMLEALAGRIAENRVVAGLHFPTDGEEGKKLAVYLDAVLEKAACEPHDDSNVFSWLWHQALLEWKEKAR